MNNVKWKITLRVVLIGIFLILYITLHFFWVVASYMN